jgi:hypothetical protein
MADSALQTIAGIAVDNSLIAVRGGQFSRFFRLSVAISENPSGGEIGSFPAGTRLPNHRRGVA